MTLKYLPLHTPQIRFADLVFALAKKHMGTMLESKLATYLDSGVKVIGSGRYAIKIALKTLGTRAGDEVILPAFICSSVGEAVIETGATPVFADVAKDDINIDPNGIKDLITNNTKAIVVAHIFGIPAQIGRLIELSQAQNIPIIEDCCQSFGAKYGGKLTGTWGNFGVFSFGISKNIGTSGGGAICYQKCYSREINDALQCLRLSSQHKNVRPSRYLTAFATPIALNKHFYGVLRNAISSYSVSKNAEPFSAYEGDMTNLEAALAIKQLERYEKTKKVRNENALIYRDHFGDYFKLVNVPDESEPAYLYFPILTAHAKELKNKLRNYSIEVKDKDDMLFGALYKHPRFSEYGYKKLENVEQVENEYLLFPVGYGNTETEEICKKTIRIIMRFRENLL